jgi:hypothetical protein
MNNSVTRQDFLECFTAEFAKRYAEFFAGITSRISAKNKAKSLATASYMEIYTQTYSETYEEIYPDNYIKAYAKGLAQTIIYALNERFGDPGQELKNKLDTHSDLLLLESLVQISLKCDSLTEFIKHID